jgi:hypothetical protein
MRRSGARCFERGGATHFELRRAPPTPERDQAFPNELGAAPGEPHGSVGLGAASVGLDEDVTVERFERFVHRREGVPSVRG